MKPGFADVIVGMDNGDEGKGKEIDHRFATGNYHINARYNGGNNAGHSLVLPDGSDLVLHALPSAVLYPEVRLYIGSGCVVDPVKLVSEIGEVESKGYSLDGRLSISTCATIISPTHILLDQITGALIGTTGNGIGPAYADRALRSDGRGIRNIRIAELLHDPVKVRQEFVDHYEALLKILPLAYRNMVNAYLAKRDIVYVDFDDKFEIKFDRHFTNDRKVDALIQAIKNLDKRGFINHDQLWMTRQIQEGKNVLLEGAQGSDLDVAKGPVPNSTSSHTWASHAYTGGDLSPKYHRHTIGVTKAIPSRVGRGPFVSELGGKRSDEYCAEDGGKKYNRQHELDLYDIETLLDSNDPLDVGIAIRMLGGEYGATTKRPRRMGVFDLKKLAHNCMAQGIDELVISKVDCLSVYDQIKIWEGKIPLVVEYKSAGENVEHIPVTTAELENLEPVYETIDGFAEDISGVREYEDLPQAAKKFIRKVQEYTRTRVHAIGVGPKREQMIYLYK